MCHTSAGCKFQIFNLGVPFLHQLGNVPYPSYPALCREDTTFHGGTAYGEHHATSITNMRFTKHVKNAFLVNQVFAQERNCNRARNLASHCGSCAARSLMKSDHVGSGGQMVAQEARRSAATMHAKRYADCGLEDMRAKSNGKHNIFRTF